MFGPAQTPPRFLTLAMMAAVSVLSFNMIAPSLAAIATEFGASYGAASFAVSGFLAINAVLYLVLGPLSDRFGRRPVLLWSAAVFALASLGAALATEIWVFLLFRTLQAAIAGGSVISAAIVRDMSEPDEAASRLGYLSMAMAVAPMVGPMIGGILDQVFGWRAVFWTYTGLGAALFWLSWVDCGETNTRTSQTFATQMRRYPDLLRSRLFWAYSLVMCCGIGAFYVFIAGAPFVAAEIFGLSPALLGLGIGTITLGFFCGSFVSGRIAARLGVPRMILLGRWVPVIGLALVLCGYWAGVFNPVLFFIGAISAGIGNGLTTPSARAGSMSVQPDLAGSASGLGGAMVIAFGAVLTQITGALLSAQNGVWMLLSLMLGLSVAGLAMAYWIRRDQTHRVMA